MTSPPEAIQDFQNGLHPFIKPREQVNYIRRVLALHLSSSSPHGPLQQPLSLVDSSYDIEPTPDLKGIRKEYVAALQANIIARRQFDDVFQSVTSRDEPSEKPPTTDHSPLSEHLAYLKLQKKRQTLLLVQRYANDLSDKPASATGFLDTEQLFRGAMPLPKVPNDVINSLVAEQSTSTPDIGDRVSQLEKAVLRAKLLLKHEETLLREARARCKIKPDVVSNGAKLEALNATRNELINWIETELSKASSEEPDDGVDSNTHGNNWKSNADESVMTIQLDTIRDKYAKYLASRKQLLELVAQRPPPSMPPPTQQTQASFNSNDKNPTPLSYLMTPYLDRLLSVSRQQKAIIAQKSHINASLGKLRKDSCQQLGHLVEESQLLPAYPMKDSMRRRSGIQAFISTHSSDQPDISIRIKPWVFSADSSKIATLESVAESIERGQIALESSMNTLQDIDQLLGRGHIDDAREDSIQEEPSDADVWLGAGGSHDTRGRKHSETTRSRPQNGDDIWSVLHGNLGLIGQDDTA